MSWLTNRSSARDSGLGHPNPGVQRPSVLLDEFFESYVYWREACEDVRMAYRRWRQCERPQRGLAFEGYRAALDREEHAARIHSEPSERLRALECA
jgi:hypothetical protein